MSVLRWRYIVVPFLLGACATPGPSPARHEYRQRHMGIEARVIVHARAEGAAASAARAAFARMALLDSLLSDYRADSELTRLSDAAGGPPMAVSAELFHVLSRAREFARLTDGAFDPTIGPLVRLWREARRTGVLPAAPEIEAARALTGWRHLELDSVARTARLALPGMRLDLGGIAKGYAADEALRAIRAAGVERALVEMGGDIVTGDPPPGSPGWRVALLDAGSSSRPVTLARAAISTSGDTEQFVEIGGVRYSHVVDPATGLGLRERFAATVIAPEGITADALSTTLTVLGPDRARDLLARHFPRVRATVRRVDGATLR